MDNPFATDVFDPFAQNNQAMQTEGWSVLWCCVTLYICNIYQGREMLKSLPV
jgi:hypothetical protein